MNEQSSRSWTREVIIGVVAAVLAAIIVGRLGLDKQASEASPAPTGGVPGEDREKPPITQRTKMGNEPVTLEELQGGKWHLPGWGGVTWYRFGPDWIVYTGGIGIGNDEGTKMGVYRYDDNILTEETFMGTTKSKVTWYKRPNLIRFGDSVWERIR